jgi:hypothetical protein
VDGLVGDVDGAVAGTTDAKGLTEDARGLVRESLRIADVTQAGTELVDGASIGARSSSFENDAAPYEIR